MAISLYDLSVPTFLQTTRALSRVLDRAARHCAETGANANDFAEASLYPGMAPFNFQIEAVKNHAVWGVKAVMTGAFAPPPLAWAKPFAELQAMVGEAVTALEAFTPDEVNAASGKDLIIEIYQPVDEENHTASRWVPGPWLSRQRPTSCRIRYPISIFTPSPPTTSCARGACRSESLITRAGCGPRRTSPRLLCPARGALRGCRA